MKRFVAGADRAQSTLLPESLDDWVDESNPVRVIDAFVDALNVAELGFDGVEPAATGRPSYHPSSLLKLYIYGYLNRVQSSRRLEREAGRNLEPSRHQLPAWAGSDTGLARTLTGMRGNASLGLRIGTFQSGGPSWQEARKNIRRKT